MRRLLVSASMLAVLLTCAKTITAQAADPALAPLESMYPDLESFYIDLHQTPELSMHEEKTSAKLADRLRKLGYEVTTGVGGTGVRIFPNANHRRGDTAR